MCSQRPKPFLLLHGGRPLPVYIDPDLPIRGEYVPAIAGYGPRIVLREYDEHVLVHEMLHHVLDRYLPDDEYEAHKAIWATHELMLAAPRILRYLGTARETEPRSDPWSPATSTTASSETTATPS